MQSSFWSREVTCGSQNKFCFISCLCTCVLFLLLPFLSPLCWIPPPPWRWAPLWSCVLILHPQGVYYPFCLPWLCLGTTVIIKPYCHYVMRRVFNSLLADWWQGTRFYLFLKSQCLTQFWLRVSIQWMCVQWINQSDSGSERDGEDARTITVYSVMHVGSTDFLFAHSLLYNLGS